MFDGPDPVEAERIGEACLLERVIEDLLLDAAYEGARHRQLEEDPELHAASVRRTIARLAPGYAARMSWLPEHAAGSDDFERSFALRPDLFAAWQAFAGIFWEKRLVDPVLLELCRLRVAQLHRAAHPLSMRTPEAVAAGLDEAKIARLESWWREPGFSELERACLHFAEQFVRDAKAIRDDDAAPLLVAFGEPGLVAFVEALAIFDGFGRFCRMLDVQPREAAS